MTILTLLIVLVVLVLLVTASLIFLHVFLADDPRDHY